MDHREDHDQHERGGDVMIRFVAALFCLIFAQHALAKQKVQVTEVKGSIAFMVEGAIKNALKKQKVVELTSSGSAVIVSATTERGAKGWIADISVRSGDKVVKTWRAQAKEIRKLSQTIEKKLWKQIGSAIMSATPAAASGGGGGAAAEEEEAPEGDDEEEEDDAPASGGDITIAGKTAPAKGGSTGKSRANDISRIGREDDDESSDGGSGSKSSGGSGSKSGAGGSGSGSKSGAGGDGSRPSAGIGSGSRSGGDGSRSSAGIGSGSRSGAGGDGSRSGSRSRSGAGGDDASDGAGLIDSEASEKRAGASGASDGDLRSSRASGASASYVRNTTPISATLGLNYFTRSLRYKDDLFGELRPYTLSGAPAPVLDLHLYPAAFLGGGIAAHLGVSLHAEYALALKSKDSANREFPTSELELEFALRGRLPFAGHEATLSAGAGTHSFSIDNAGDGADPDVPGVSYTFLRIGLDARFEIIEALNLTLSGAYRPVLSAGEISEEAWFGRASTGAVDAGFRIAYAVLPSLDVIVGADMRRYFYTLNPEPGDARVAGGALDQYFSGTLAIGWHLR